MGEKDIAEKTLEAYDDVFADIVNSNCAKTRKIAGKKAPLQALLKEDEPSAKSDL